MNKVFCIRISVLFCLLMFINTSAFGKKKFAIPVSVILDTDMGNDIDDALALDMLYKYLDKGEVNLLGIVLNKDYTHSPEYVDIMSTWYGYPHIPIGIYKTGEKLQTNDRNYTQRVCNQKLNGQPAFKRTIEDYNSLPESYKLYRKILSEQPDHSVTVISIGFLTNLALLLETPSDEYSHLTGKELVKKKVKLLSVMAGSFTEKPYAEYNIMINKKAASRVFAEWPSHVVVSPFELGDSIKYPGLSIENDFRWSDLHPLVEGYKTFSKMPFDRSTWDLTSVLYVAEPDSSFFNLSPKGIIISDDEGYTHFIADKNGRHQYLTTNPEQRKAILKYFVKLISSKPKKYK